MRRTCRKSVCIIAWAVLWQPTLARADELPDDVEQLIDMLAISKQQDSSSDGYEAYKKLGSLGPSAFPQLVSHLEDKRPSAAAPRAVSQQTVGFACFHIIQAQIFPVPGDYQRSFYRTGADGKLHESVILQGDAV